MLWYLRTPPPPPQTFLVSPSGVPVSPSGVPVTGAQKGGGVRERGSNDPPPPPRKPISPPALMERCLVIHDSPMFLLLLTRPRR